MFKIKHMEGILQKFFFLNYASGLWYGVLFLLYLNERKIIFLNKNCLEALLKFCMVTYAHCLHT